MTYLHTFLNNNFTLNAGKVVCIGRNYLEHIRELRNPIPKNPVLFIKPFTSLVEIAKPIHLPTYSENCHHEIEIAVLIGTKLIHSSPQDAKNAIIGIALALDLTLRDIQSQLKDNGHPWERAKAFDHSCPISPFIEPEKFDFAAIHFHLLINGEIRQEGNSKSMMMGIIDLICHLNQFFTLLPGDVVLTGTPKGVDRLCSEDQLELVLNDEYRFSTVVS